jgi:hypothetical protein
MNMTHKIPVEMLKPKWTKYPCSPIVLGLHCPVANSVAAESNLTSKTPFDCSQTCVKGSYSLRVKIVTVLKIVSVQDDRLERVVSMYMLD